MDEKLKELESDAPDRLEQTTQGIPKLPEMTADIVLEVQRQQLEALRSENAILNEEIAEAKRIYEILQGTCDDYEIRLGRDYEGWMPQMVENSVPVLCQMLAEERAEGKRVQDLIRALDAWIDVYVRELHHGYAWETAVRDWCAEAKLVPPKANTSSLPKEEI